MQCAIHEPSGASISVYIGSKGLGDTIAAIPTMRKIVEAHGNLPIILYSYYPHLFVNHPLIYEAKHINNWKAADTVGFGYDKSKENSALEYTYKTFDSIAGRSHYLSHDQKIEFKYPVIDIRQYHAISLGFELKTHEMATDLYIEKAKEFDFSDYVIINVSDTWPTRTWKSSNWQQLINNLNANDIPTVVVGQTNNKDSPANQLTVNYGANLVNDPTNDIAQLRWMMQYQAKAVVTMDSGILHVAGTTDVPIIQLDSSIDPKLRAPVRYGSQDWNYYLVQNKCAHCASDLKFSVTSHNNIHAVPPISHDCMYERDYSTECHPSVDQVFNQILQLDQVTGKVRLVHLLLNDDSDPQRQENSIDSLAKLEQYGIEYVQVWNNTYKEKPPKETFTRPDQFDQIPIQPEHYGAYKAHADTVMQYFDIGVDYLLICEGDCLLTLSPKETAHKINEAIKAIHKHDIKYFSFGSRYSLTHNVLQSQTLEKDGNIHIVDNIIGTQMVMFPQNIRKYLIDKFKYATWDGIDIFLTDIFVNKFNMGMFDSAISTQASGVSTIDKYNKDMEKENKKTKLLFLAPHLSTGGMPQFLLNRIKTFQHSITQHQFEIYVIEFTKYSDHYIVQRNEIKKLLDKDHFISCSENYNKEESDMDRSGVLLSKIMNINPDIIHIEECPEAFDGFNRIRKGVLNAIYDQKAPWRIIESCHNNWTTWNDKTYKPDGFAFVTPYHLSNNFNNDNIPTSKVIQSPIYEKQPLPKEKRQSRDKLNLDPNKTHVLNVGLWSPLKNQAELVQIAKELENHNIEFHFVGNRPPNFKDYWQPLLNNLPNNVHVWGERSDVETFYQACDVFSFHSTQECNPLSIREAISYGLKVILNPLDSYSDMYDPYVYWYRESDIEAKANELVKIIDQNDTTKKPLERKDAKFIDFRDEHIELYNSILNQQTTHRVMSDANSEKFIIKQEKEGFFLHCFNLEQKSYYSAQFKAPDTFNNYQNVFTPDNLESNCWYSPLITYYLPWRVEIYKNKELIYVYNHDLKQTHTGVRINSDSIGDNLAFVGQLINFKKEHQIDTLTVFTNKYYLFDLEEYEKLNIYFKTLDKYSDTKVDHAYELGVYYNSKNANEYNKPNHHPFDWRWQPLGKIAADILGIDYYEERPILDKDFVQAKPDDEEIYNQNVVTFGIESTAQAKHWNYPNGWEILADYYREAGFDVYNLKKNNALNNVHNIEADLLTCCAYINYSNHFVGLSSGLSWLAWALNQRVILISGFTHEDVEFKDKCWRVINKSVCNNCWGRYAFNPGDWNWCPDHKGTFRQFECTKSITPHYVWTFSQDIINQTHGVLQKPVENLTQNINKDIIRNITNTDK